MSPRKRLGLLVVACLSLPAIVQAQGITIPNTFVNGTVADADQVNANFSLLANVALNRTAGVMTGALTSLTITPTADAASDLGSGVLRYNNVYAVTFNGSLPAANVAAGNFPSGVTYAGSAFVVAGKNTLWVPANAMTAAVTNGATGPTTTELTAGTPNITTLSFVNGSQTNAQFAVAMPKSWNAGTITFQAFWTGTAAGAGNVIWGLQCVASADNATIDTAFGTAVEVTDTFLSVKFAHVAAESSAVTIASAAANTLTTCQVYRKGTGGDTRAAASLLLGIKLFFTTNANNDQ